MKDTKLGILIDSTAVRDAIHIAIAPVVAVERLAPGTHIGFIEGTDRVGTNSKTLIGVVDPFLKQPVFEGERFWMLLYPQTITSLKHLWTHPAFDSQATQLSEFEQSKAWLVGIAGECGVSYEHMMDAVGNEDFINMGDNENYKNVNIGDDFKRHCEIVLGRKLEHAPYPFSCSC